MDCSPSQPKSVPSYEGIFGKLLKNVERSNPREFRLPDVIRNAFTNGRWTVFEPSLGFNVKLIEAR
jgi:hypothetical protein